MEHLRVSEALGIILESVSVAGIETVMLEQSLGRVLAEAVSANRDLPPYDVSAMDGFAVRSADVANAPAQLEIIEDIKAGDMPARTVQAGQCARIMTGAPVPQGADAVIRVEDTREISAGKVEILQAVKSGNDIRLQGEGMKNGDVVLQAGTEITPGVVGVLATVKAARFAVYRRPRVAILSTGDELEGMHDPVDPNKIPNSNSYALMAQVQALGIEPVLLGIARDDPVELERYLRRGLEYDVLLVSGGTSVGVHDYVRPTIEKLGVQMKFWRVAIKPGHPLAFGTTRQYTGVWSARQSGFQHGLFRRIRYSRVAPQDGQSAFVPAQRAGAPGACGEIPSGPHRVHPCAFAARCGGICCHFHRFAKQRGIVVHGEGGWIAGNSVRQHRTGGGRTSHRAIAGRHGFSG